ncbi:MAG: hypothetical protein E6Q97_39280 [Desulfurellales bacterium]|nr:MAG: hypothetical protein E6Q97_39280 [Desulfurellales bacterium]
MSTTFGILKAGLTWDEETPIPGECFVKVAFRTNSGGMYWLNDAGTALPDDMKVYPIDNSAQGIHTIGDIKKAIYD